MLSLPISAYHIGIICALPKEAAAVVAVLDDEHEPLTEQGTNDSNIYVLGRIHKHNVVITCLPAGKYGITKAATAANNLLRTFTDVRIGLMVGIGGGIPNLPKDDIRLGDVVISQPDGTLGGVVQYDLVKDLGNGEFERKGSLDAPPSVLLTALSALQVRNRGISNHLKDVAVKHPELATRVYSFPGAEKDQLQCTDCGSIRPWWQKWLVLLLAFLWAPWRCQVCKNGYILRQPRAHHDPVIHYGIIASGSRLIKNATRRDRLGQEFKAKCVEMEAAGLMDDFRCIVIRGICDYADSCKNDEWQEYAAVTAAACAKELLRYVVPSRVDKEQPLSEVIGVFREQLDVTKELLEETRQQAQKLETRYQNDLHRKCHYAFRTTAYESFKNINPPRVPNTCQWALDNDVFRQWFEGSKDDLLWISADPGCGKSVLARSLIENELHTSDDHRVCYFFFKDNEVQNNLSAALSALIHQLFDFEPQLIEHAILTWQKNGERPITGLDDLWRIFWAAARDSQVSSVTCVVDALDECEGKDRKILIGKLMEWYKELSLKVPSEIDKKQYGHVKFLVTSRPYSDIEADFHLPPHLPCIRLRGEDENDQIHQEIDMVIKVRVDEVAAQLKLKKLTRDRLETQLLQMEHRTYLWLHLAIESIYDTFGDSLRPDEESIELLPSTVDDAYKRILSKVKEKKQNDVKLVLTIIVGAKRPLTIGEMAIALGIATTPNSTQLSGTLIDEHWLKDRIREWCGLFVFFNDSRIYLIHQTAKEFLVSKQGVMIIPETWKYCLDLTQVEQVMARICIDILTFRDVQELGKSLSTKSKAKGIFSRPVDVIDQESANECFILYAAENWANHVRNAQSPIGESLESKFQALYDVSEPVFAWWFPLFWAAANLYLDLPEINTLCLAAWNGHHDFVEYLLEDGTTDVNQRDGIEKTAIIWASEYNRQSVVSLLLDKGADVNVTGGKHGTALCRASAEGHLAIVKLLLSKGADINATGGNYGTALCRASAGGHLAIVKLLLSKGADIDATGEDYGTALCGASAEGHLAIVKLLLSKGADIDATGGYYGTALCGASTEGHLTVVELLLSKGADINATGGYYGTALCGASARGYLAIVKLLVSKGADINVTGEDCDTALCGASAGGHLAIVKLLLSKGADINATGGIYGTALYGASTKGHLTVVELLLSKGADIDATGGYYGTALCGASAEGHLVIVELLLGEGAAINARGRYYGMALYGASAGGHLTVVELLLSKGAEINAIGGKYGTALCEASVEGRLAIVELLLSKGADINTTINTSYGTALCGASAKGHLAIVELLLSKGADVNTTVGGDCGTALYGASAEGHLAIVELLVSKGADVNATFSGDYGTALCGASAGGHLAIIELLISEGADITGGRYSTALYRASSEGHLTIVELLLSKGADFNIIGSRGTALDVASDHAVIELLLSKGATTEANIITGGSESKLQSLLSKDGERDDQSRVDGRVEELTAFSNVETPIQKETED